MATLFVALGVLDGNLESLLVCGNSWSLSATVPAWFRLQRSKEPVSASGYREKRF